MNIKNLEELQENMKYLGFGEEVRKELAENIQAGKPEFNITSQAKFGEATMDYTQHFRKGNKDEMYFYNGMDTSLSKPGEQAISQHFFSNQNITAKEAYNLLEGRAVYKTYNIYEKQGEGTDAKYQWTPEKYNTWVQLDFNKLDDKNNRVINRYHDNYGFDIEDKLKKLPVKENADPDQYQRIIKSLKKGNLQEVTLERDGMSEKISLAANPAYRNFKAYDQNGNRLEEKELKVSRKQSEVIGDDKKKLKQETAEDEPRRGKKMGR